MANQPQQPDIALHNASHLMQYHDLIESIVAALDARDAYTASHSDRVADMVLVLAAALGLDEDETTRIHTGRPPARHRQDRRAGFRPAQGRAADPARMGGNAPPSRDRV